MFVIFYLSHGSSTYLNAGLGHDWKKTSAVGMLRGPRLYVTIIVFAVIRVISAIFLKVKTKTDFHCKSVQDTLDEANNDAQQMAARLGPFWPNFWPHSS